MVDVGDKVVTERTAIAKGEVLMKQETLTLIQQGELAKGDVLTVAQLAGVMAAKRTAELIPLCHLLPIDQILVEITPNPDLPGVEITATVRTNAKTGVEMEALTAVSVAALTVFFGRWKTPARKVCAELLKTRFSIPGGMSPSTFGG